MGILPIIICTELNTVLGAGMIFASGVVYGFMALGKKADRSMMMGAHGTANPNHGAWSPTTNTQTVPPPVAVNMP